MKSGMFFAAGLSALLLTCQTVMGQVNFGVKAGMNLETQSELGQLWDNNEIRTGFLVGGTVEYALNNKLSLQTEVNFIQKGEKKNYSLLGTDVDAQTECNYLTVPLLIKGSFNEELGLGDKWNVFGYTGPYYGYMLSAKCKTTINGSTENTDITDDSIRNDWGLIFGGGVSHNLSDGNALFAELRYDMGLYKIDNDNSDLRNKVISLCVGFNF